MEANHSEGITLTVQLFVSSFRCFLKPTALGFMLVWFLIVKERGAGP